MRLLPTGRKNSLAIFVYSSFVGMGSFLLGYLPRLLQSTLVEIVVSKNMYNPVCSSYWVETACGPDVLLTGSFDRSVLNNGMLSGWILIVEVKKEGLIQTREERTQKCIPTAVCSIGFTSLSKDFSNKMFLLFFKKKEKSKK